MKEDGDEKPSPSEEKAQGVDLAAKGDEFFYDVVEHELAEVSSVYLFGFLLFSIAYRLSFRRLLSNK